MTDRTAAAGASTTHRAAWTCPFCPLLCDAYGVGIGESGITLSGSGCTRAVAALASFTPPAATAAPMVSGSACDLPTAVAAAAATLRGARLPLFAGLGTDVAGARALFELARRTGAIADAAGGAALMQGLRALQDRGAFTTTLAEVRARADVIVCIGGSPAEAQPEFFRRCGLMDEGAPARQVVFLGGPAEHAAALAGLPNVTARHLPLQGDLFDTLSLLALALAGRPAPPPLATLAQQLQDARYAVLSWEGARLPAQGALLVEAIHRIVVSLNRKTRAAMLPLGGGDGAATANQVFAWLGGLPLRTQLHPQGQRHDPQAFDTARLLADGAVDALLWVQAFRPLPLPETALAPIVLGHPAMAGAVRSPGSVFIPVATPGIGHAGHLFRTDGVVLMPLHAALDQRLPSVAEVVTQIGAALVATREAA